MTQGFAFGAGNAVAHETVRRVLSSGTNEKQHPCKAILEELHECLEKEYNCDHILDKLAGCSTRTPS
jgi:hypothetical protein